MQEGEGSWLPVADTGGAFSAVAALRRLFARLGHVVPVGHVGVYGTAKVFLLRDVEPHTGHNHWGSRVDGLAGDGRLPLPKRAYKHYMVRLREALQVCCNMSEAAAGNFGTQSLRSGGDTHLFHLGFGSEERCFMGQWATPPVEVTYLRPQVGAHLGKMQQSHARWVARQEAGK